MLLAGLQYIGSVLYAICQVELPFRVALVHIHNTHTHTSQNGRTITLQTSNIPTGLNYQCVFDFGNHGDRVERSSTHNGDQVTCTVPTRSQIPDLPAGQGQCMGYQIALTITDINRPS